MRLVINFIDSILNNADILLHYVLHIIQGIKYMTKLRSNNSAKGVSIFNGPYF